MKRKFFALICILAAFSFILAGCRRSSGIYTDEDMTKVHDIVGSVQQWNKEYSNVIDNSVLSTLNSKLSSDPDFIDYLSTRNLDPDKPMIALTFDDGPSAKTTSKILDVLEKYNAKATFFVVGSNAAQNGGLLKRMQSMGCEVGNHTYDHKELTQISAAEVKTQLSKTDAVIRKYTGQDCRIIRPPGGAVSTEVRKEVDKPMILWYVDTRDWESSNAQSVISNAEEYAEDGTIVLMHDIYSSTEQAIETIVPDLAAKGYQFVTVSELAYMKGVKLKSGGEYFDFIKGDKSNITSDPESESEAVDLSGNTSDDYNSTEDTSASST